MDNRIKIKVGGLEVEYEGSVDFLEGKLLKLMTSLAELQDRFRLHDLSKDDTSRDTDDSLAHMSTSAIAQKLNVKTGPDLAVAAAARLSTVLGRKTFTRADLLKEMKEATAYYKSTFSDNLTSILRRLVKKGKLTEQGKDTYALGSTEVSRLRTTLAK